VSVLLCADRCPQRRGHHQAVADHRDTRYYPNELPNVGGGAIMVTLTARYNRGDDLTDLLDDLVKSWRNVTGSGSYAEDAELFDIVGWVRSWTSLRRWTTDITRILTSRASSGCRCRGSPRGGWLADVRPVGACAQPPWSICPR
jgi:hypothetical protein